MNNMQTHPNPPVAAFGLIGLGFLFLGSVIFGYNIFNLWPFFMIVPGAVMFMVAQRGGPAGLSVPGAITGGTGLILLYQSMTGHWESWAYAWALYPVFTGIGLSVMGRNMMNEHMVASGQNSIRFGLLAFAIGWAFFEGMIFNSGGLGGLALPLALIAAGVAMLYWRPAGAGKRKFGPQHKAKYADVHGDPQSSLQARIDAALAEDDEDEKTYYI